ncbi:MAG: murein biosynthesis integral membrane protein MurJ [Acidimicrobiales bacterium]
MSDTPRRSAPVVHRPRTIAPGAPARDSVVVRPRTITALGRPEPVSPLPPPLEAMEDPTWQPPTGPVPVVTLREVDPEGGSDEPLGATAAPGRLLRNNALVASGTALSRLTGLVRTTLIYGLLFKTLGDTYLLANNTPNIIYELILGGVLTATLVPIFTDDLENGDGDATAAVVSFTVVVLGGLALLTAALSPLLIWVYSLGSPAGQRADLRATGIRLAVLFAPQVFFYGLMALWSAVLNARHRFFAAAWAPVLNNLVVIGVLVATWRATDGKPRVQDLLDRPALLLLLGLGTTAGIALMALSLYPALRRSGMRMRFRFQPRHPAVRRAIRLSAWTLGYVIANQVAGAVVSILAKPGSGGVKDYQTAFQFFQLPHGLLAVSIMVTFEPLLGRAEARGDRRSFNDQLLLGFRLIGLLVVPATIGYLALPHGLRYAVDPARGSNLGNILHLGGIVGAFAIGLPGFSTYLFALRGFYAMKDTRTPFLVNCLENGINIVAAVILVHFFGVVGLALAYGIAYTLAAFVAVALLARRSPGFDVRGLVVSWFKLLLAGVVMGGFVFGFVAVAAPVTTPLVIGTVAVAILVGAVTYFAGIYVLRVPGVTELFDRLPLSRSKVRP